MGRWHAGFGREVAKQHRLAADRSAHRASWDG
jgi:hypothetical protein